MMNNVKKICLIALIGVLAACSSGTDGTNAKEKLVAAKEAGNSVFMVVTKKGVPVDSVMAIVQDANKSIKKNVVLTMDMDDASNADLVQEYMLTDARLPVVLLFTNKGIMLGGMTKSQVSKEALLETIPTPKFGDIILAISQGKSIFTIVSKSSFADRETVLGACMAAQREMPTSVEIVEVDMEDKAEANLIKLLNLNTATTETLTIVFNPLGETTGQFNGVPEQSELVAAARGQVPRDCSQDHDGEDCDHDHH